MAMWLFAVLALLIEPAPACTYVQNLFALAANISCAGCQSDPGCNITQWCNCVDLPIFKVPIVSAKPGSTVSDLFCSVCGSGGGLQFPQCQSTFFCRNGPAEGLPRSYPTSPLWTFAAVGSMMLAIDVGIALVLCVRQNHISTPPPRRVSGESSKHRSSTRNNRHSHHKRHSREKDSHHRRSSTRRRSTSQSRRH